MKNWITFSDFTTNQKGFLIEQLDEVPMPEKKLNFIEVEGYSGYLTQDEYAYKPIDYNVTITVKDRKNIQKIRNSFHNSGSGKLILSNDPTRFYYAKVINAIEFKRTIRDVYECVITFKLQPYAYEVKNNVQTINIVDGSPTSYTMTNTTNTPCRPLIKIIGSGDIILNFNSSQVKITGLEEHIILDFEFQEAYSINSHGLKVNKNQIVRGYFPKIDVGTTKISWIGNVTQIDITPNYRWR